MIRTVYRKVAYASGFIIKASCITHCIFYNLFDFVIANGPSMEPTLSTGNILLSNRLSVKLGKINRGDIVIARNPEKPKQLICKRVLGLEGDIIRAQVKAAEILDADEFPFEDRFLIEAFDEQKHNENVEKKNRILGQNQYNFKDVIISRGHVWIEGDNAGNSTDSRHYGPIPKGLILSKVVFRLFPFNSIGFIC